VTADRELADVRAVIEETRTQADAVEQARDAITIDAADLLARAEAQASELLERANRDAEAIRQEAVVAAEAIAPRTEHSGGNGSGSLAEDALRSLGEQVGRLERKVAKQRRRLDRLTGKRSGKTPPPKTADSRRASASARDVITSAEQEAAEIRQSARRDRERFQAELVGLLSRFASLDDEPED
jgi:F0F1-type ATP synthase membrane subunit b/b'